MSIARKTYTLAIRDLFDPRVISAGAEALVKHGANVVGGVASDAAGKIAGDTVKKMVDRIRGHFTDHSDHVILAIRQSYDRALETLEIAIAGPSFWESTWFGKLKTSATDQRLIENLREYFADAVIHADPAYLQNCLKQLRRARESGLIAQLQAFRLEELVDESNPFARFDDPAALIDAELALIDEIAREFRLAGFADLAMLLAVKPPHGQHVLAVAAQFHFRSAVLADDKLRNEFQHVKLERLSGDLADGLRFLSGLMASNAAQIEEVLDGVGRLEIKVDAIHADTRETYCMVAAIYSMVYENSRRQGFANRPLSAQHQLSMNAAESPKVDESIRKHDAMPAHLRQQHSNLSLSVSREAWVGGRFEDSRRIARELATTSKNPLKKAEGFDLAYRCSLELDDFEAAFEELKESLKHNPTRGLFDFRKYEPQAIIGAGAFAVAFLCTDQHTDETVVVKTFEPAGLELPPREIFREARLLRNLRNPHIIDLLHCDFFDAGNGPKPFLVLEYLEGSEDLERYLKRRSEPLSPSELMTIALPIATGVKAAHGRGVLHRDIKPANILVRQTGDSFEVKIIDFGLAMRQERLAASQRQQILARKSMIGSSVAGTPDYAAPEQLDPDRIKEIGAHSDVYAFGRLCYFALFGITSPTPRKTRTMSEQWQDLLSDCTEHAIDERLKSFDEVLDRLRTIAAPRTAPVVQPVAQPPKPVNEHVEVITTSASAPPNRETPKPLPPEQPKPAAQPAPAKAEPAKPVSVSAFDGQKAGDRKVLKLDTLEIPLRWCPPGKFTMGSPKTDTMRYIDEDQVDVILTRGFWMMETPVTQGLCLAVIGENFRWSEEYTLGPNHPASDLDWAISNDFAAKLTQMLIASGQLPKDMKLTLPTEAQWEYACRADTTTRFPFGEDPVELKNYAWFAGTREFSLATQEVGKKSQNAWGLYDMLGNVWEWCADWYGEKLPGGDDPVGPHQAALRVRRGGSWRDDYSHCRSANRSRRTRGDRYGSTGCRLAAVRAQ